MTQIVDWPDIPKDILKDYDKEVANTWLEIWKEIEKQKAIAKFAEINAKSDAQRDEEKAKADAQRVEDKDKSDAMRSEEKAISEQNRSEQKTIQESKIAIDKAKLDDFLSRKKLVEESNQAAIMAVHNAYIEVAKGQIKLAADRADFVQKIAVALGAAYTAVLAFSFAKPTGAENAIYGLPVSGIAPTMFFGIAFTFSAAYIAYMRGRKDSIGFPAMGNYAGDRIARRNTFIKWINASVDRNKYMLQVSVVSLGIGVLFLPAPYLLIVDWSRFWLYVYGGIGLTFILPILLNFIDSRMNRKEINYMGTS